MKSVKLSDRDIVAVGGERTCYAYPNCDDKIIKVVHAKGKHNEQNEVEKIYFEYLKKKNTNLSHIATYYGEIDTNFGRGLVFERVLDYDKAQSKSIRYFMVHSLISQDLQKKLLFELRDYLSKNSILFIDTSLTNIFCKKIDENNYKLVIVDGLGAKRLGFKFWLYRHCKIYEKYKIIKQWNKLFKMYKKDIKRLELGVHPIVRL